MSPLIRKANKLRLEVEDALSTLEMPGILFNQSSLRDRALKYYQDTYKAWKRAQGPEKRILETITAKAEWIHNNVRSDIWLDEGWVNDLRVAAIQLTQLLPHNEDGMARHRLVQKGSVYLLAQEA